MSDKVESELMGFASRVDAMSSLADGTGASGATSVTIAESGLMTRGIVEVGGELMMVTSFTEKTGTVPAWGRGLGGSTASAHSVGEKVTISPTFPRVAVERAVTEAVDGLWPSVFGIGKASFVVNSAQDTYPLPAASQDVLSVSVQTTGPSGRWPVVKSWRFNKTANLDTYPTGRTITVAGSALDSGMTVDVLVQVKPTLTSTTETWEELGLFDTVEVAVRYLAMSRLLAGVDLGEVAHTSASAAYAQQQEGRRSAFDMSRFYYSLFREELSMERDRMLSSYDISLTFQG